MEIDKAQKLRLLVTGAVSGAVNGFFGGGGGMALVPLLRGWIGLDDERVFATSVAVMFPMCAVSAWIYRMRVGLDLGTAWPYLLGGVLGGAVSGLSYRRVPPRVLTKAFALLILFGGVRSVLG